MDRGETVIWVRKISSEDSAKQFLKKYKKYVVGPEHLSMHIDLLSMQKKIISCLYKTVKCIKHLM
jgi:hypothetical protein